MAEKESAGAAATTTVRYAVQPQSGIHDDTGLPTDAISLTQESDDGKESGKKSAAMRVSANDGGASGRSGASRGVASPAAQSRWTNFLMCSGYAVQIVGGKHFTTPDGAFVEMKSGTQYEIFVNNTHPEGCNLDISIDGYDVGGWVLYGRQEFSIERSAYDRGSFTFYRVAKAPGGSGIERGRDENGLIECVFTPEADIPVAVSTRDRLEPVQFQMSPSATMQDVKLEAQRRLGLKEDADQLMACGSRFLHNGLKLKSCGMRPSQVFLILNSDLEITIQPSTGQSFQIMVKATAKVKDVMEEITLRIDVPAEDQKLYYGATCLSDRPERRLPEELVLLEEPVICVEIPEYLTISVRFSAAQVVQIKIGKLKTLKDLAEKVRQVGPTTGESARTCFEYQGKKLDPRNERGTLESYGLATGSTLDVVLEVESISVIVKLPGGGETTVEVEPHKPLQYLLEKLHLGSEDPSEMIVSMGGRRLALEGPLRSMKEYGIEDGTLLRVQIGRSAFWFLRHSEVRKQDYGFTTLPTAPGSLAKPDPLWRAGGTTLQGHSSQQFFPAEPIKVDQSKKVVLTLRLVARDDEEDGAFPPGEPTPLSTLYPPAVPE